MHESPHQAPNGACSDDRYAPSARVYEPPGVPDYPVLTVREHVGAIATDHRIPNAGISYTGDSRPFNRRVISDSRDNV